MNTNNSLKEYYIKIQNLYKNAVNMLTAINQSLSTASSEVTVSLTNLDNTQSQVRIPSFLYLENKLEQLDSNFTALFNIPKSGEAWFQQTNGSNMYKLNLVKSTTAPQIPQFSTDNLYAGTKANNIFKDLVNPKTYIRINISNLTDNIDSIYMDKITFASLEMYTNIVNMHPSNYSDVKAALYNYSKGVEWDEYSSILNVPIKSEQYNSEFKIVQLPTLESKNPWIDVNTSRLHYKVELDTLSYTDKEDTSISMNLKAGDFITLRNEYAIYKVNNVSSTVDTTTGNTQCFAEIEEYIGHIGLQTFEENSNMVFELYNPDYSEFHYIDIPLEENPYICVFIGTIHNGVRSQLSTPILLNLNNIYMKNPDGTYMYDNNGNMISYINYYNTYCNNIGDLIDSLSVTAYPQLGNLSNDNLNKLENSDAIQSQVTSTIEGDNIMTVTKINGHLTDSTTSNEISQLHSQKAELTSELSALQDEIDQVYSQLTTTDFSQTTTITQASLQAKLSKYYTQRITLQKQVIAVITQIDALKSKVAGQEEAKYRIRGVTNVNNLIDYLQSTIDQKVNIIGADIQYKYKAVNSDTNKITSINSTVFTDWNREITCERDRYLIFNKTSGYYELKFVDYGDSTNIIKWNQIDIPIKYGEDVVVRVRYKYNIGQPFINLYTPWSNEITVTFPSTLIEDSTVTDIISQNNDDVISAKFQQTLINDGYQNHVNDKIIDGSKTFFHNAENIYSGFSDSNNNLISLYDKLKSLETEVEEYRSIANSEINPKIGVYLQYDNNSIELNKNSQTNVLINESTTGTVDTFVSKNMNIIIKNLDNVTIKLYSIFPGDTSVPLLQDNEEFQQKQLVNYDRVPLLFGTSNDPVENTMAQTLGQWIYFRMNNPYNSRPIYFSSSAQDQADLATFKNMQTDNTIKHFSPDHYSLDLISENYKQPSLGYVLRTQFSSLLWQQLKIVYNNNTQITEAINDDYDYSSADPSIFIYDDAGKNQYVLKYEHLKGILNNKTIYFTNDIPAETFVSESNNTLINTDNLVGAFLIPNLESKNDIKCSQNNEEQYYALAPGESVSIPLLYEYYMNGNENTSKSITKGLYFDLRPSLFKDPYHYMINVTAKYNYTINNSDIVNLSNSLEDTITSN